VLMLLSAVTGFAFCASVSAGRLFGWGPGLIETHGREVGHRLLRPVERRHPIGSLRATPDTAPFLMPRCSLLASRGLADPWRLRVLLAPAAIKPSPASPRLLKNLQTGRS
jgi:hypothetical protein